MKPRVHQGHETWHTYKQWDPAKKLLEQTIWDSKKLQQHTQGGTDLEPHLLYKFRSTQVKIQEKFEAMNERQHTGFIFIFKCKFF